jgi:hypothetical protein
LRRIDVDEQEKTSEEPKKNPQPKWEKRNFRLNEHMKTVCELGISATKAEIASLKRKLEKLQYGS